MKNILVAEDHDITLKGIKSVLTGHFPEVEIAEAQNFKTVLEKVPLKNWDLIILDAEMPDGDYCDILTQIRLLNKDAFIIIFSNFAKVSCAVKAIKHSVNGLLQKGSSGNELIEAIDKIFTGHNYIHSDIAAKMAAHLDQKNNLFLHEKLSAREFEIFILIAQGCTIKVIAQMLHLSEKTIGSHLTRAREKTGLTSLVHITRYAFRCGLVT